MNTITPPEDEIRHVLEGIAEATEAAELQGYPGLPETEKLEGAATDLGHVATSETTQTTFEALAQDITMMPQKEPKRPPDKRPPNKPTNTAPSKMGETVVFVDAD